MSKNDETFIATNLTTALEPVLSLRRLRTEARLGCTEEERSVPQPVLWSLKIYFSELPEGARTDRLEGTVCYAKLSEILKSLCASGEFQLIEHLGYRAYTELRELLPASSHLWIEAVKVRPPVDGLEGGASFALTDRPARAHEFMREQIQEVL